MLIHMCDIIRSYVQHDSFIFATCLIAVCDLNSAINKHFHLDTA